MSIPSIHAGMIEQLGWVLVHSLWQFALLAVVTMALMRAMGRCTAATRYATLLAVMALMVVTPVVTWYVLPMSVEGSVREVATVVDAQPDGGTSPRPEGRGSSGFEHAVQPVGGTSPRNEGRGSSGFEHSTPRPSPEALGRATTSQTPATPWWSTAADRVRASLSTLVWAWCLGVLVFSVRPLLSGWAVWRLRTVGVSAASENAVSVLERMAGRLGLRRTVGVRQSTRIRGPIVLGSLRPVILLPVGLVTGLPVSQVEAILAHELAHIRRHDYLVNVFQTLVETLLFYHPAVWWVSGRIRHERENCCDDVAATAVGNRVEYGRALLAIEEHRAGSTTLALGVGGSSLLARVRRLLGHPPARPGGAWAIIAFGLLACVIVAIGLTVGSQARDKDDAEPAPKPVVEVIDKPEVEPPIESKVEPVLDPAVKRAIDADIEAIADGISAAISVRKLPFVGPEHLPPLREELREYLGRRVTKPMSDAWRREVLDSIDKHVRTEFRVSAPRNHGYYEFRVRFDMLKWQLWTAFDRRELTPGELRRRERQQSWMANYIRALPITENDRKYLPAEHAGQVEALAIEVFGDPLNSCLHEPMSSDEFERFKAIMKGIKRSSSISRLLTAPHCLFSEMARIREESWLKRWPPGFPVERIKVLTVMYSHDLHLHACSFRADPSPVLGHWFLGGTDGKRSSCYDVAKNTVSSVELGLNPESAGLSGDLWYDIEEHRIVPVNGATLSTLEKNEWYELDRIRLPELRHRQDESSVDSFQMPRRNRGHFTYPELNETIKALPAFVLESAEGKVSVLRMRLLESNGGHLRLEYRPRPLPPYLPFHPGDPSESAIDDDINAVADCVIESLAAWDPGFIGPEELVALHKELRDYLRRRVTRSLSDDARPKVLAALRKRVDIDFCSMSSSSGYLSFRERFDMLKWRIWTTFERHDLTSAKFKRREAQRDWMREYIRSLPITDAERDVPEFGHAGRIKTLENEVFGYPLGSFFHDPMSLEDFERFKTRLLMAKRLGRDAQLRDSPWRIYSAVLTVRVESLRERWPPGFPIGNLGMSSSGWFSFHADRATHYLFWSLGGSNGKQSSYFDMARRLPSWQSESVAPEVAARQLAARNQGDLWHDANTHRLIPANGAKLATLEETEWYELDRIRLPELRRLVAESSVDSFTLPNIDPGQPDLDAVDEAIRTLPTFVLESADGTVMLLRMKGRPSLGGRCHLQVRPRPLPPYPPFHQGDTSELPPRGQE